MREVKFRAWLLHEEEMAWVAAIEFRDNKAFIVRQDGREGWRTFSEINLQEYAGLEDINGIKICEGDLIRYSGRNGSDLYEIIFTDGCFNTKCITTPGDWNNDPMAANALDFKEHWKVIGNIYENPELMEG